MEDCQDSFFFFKEVADLDEFQTEVLACLMRIHTELHFV